MECISLAIIPTHAQCQNWGSFKEINGLCFHELNVGFVSSGKSKDLTVHVGDTETMVSGMRNFSEKKKKNDGAGKLKGKFDRCS